jgi:two-component system alkaline phosphatase synthesis response regulator PhoP
MGKRKILIIDDEEIILFGLRNIFEDMGYEVVTALDGKEGLDTAKRERPDLVYVDLLMPRMNGVEVCEGIKKILPGTEVIMFSGHLEEMDKRRADFVKAGGRPETLKKPFAGEKIVSLTRKVLGEPDEEQKPR